MKMRLKSQYWAHTATLDVVVWTKPKQGILRVSLPSQYPSLFWSKTTARSHSWDRCWIVNEEQKRQRINSTYPKNTLSIVHSNSRLQHYFNLLPTSKVLFCIKRIITNYIVTVTLLLGSIHMIWRGAATMEIALYLYVLNLNCHCGPNLASHHVWCVKTFNWTIHRPRWASVKYAG